MHTLPRCRIRPTTELCSWFRSRPSSRATPSADPGPVEYLGKRSVGWTVSAAVLLAVVYWSWNFWFIRQPEKELSIQKAAALPFLVSSDHILFEIGSGSFVSLTPTKSLNESAEIQLVFDDPDIVDIPIHSFTIEAGSTPGHIFIPLHSRQVAGHCVLSFKTKSRSKALHDLFKVRVQIQVVHQIFFGYLSIFIGWVYFCFWSTCYYPQIYYNYRRRSVVGFSFDYLALNITGHLCYLVFNLSMYYNNAVQKQFTKLHPKGQLPVKLNDVLFSVHAISMNMVLLSQCVLYERADQRVTTAMKTLVGALWVTIIGSLGAAITEKVSWLQFLYYLTYIKVGSTPIKYTPQVYMNYSRKSTEGWSIQGTLLDVGGGVFSFLQMAIDAINNDDLDGTLGNPGKLGLSAVAMIYDSIFMTQHFICYGSLGRRRKVTAKSEDLEALVGHADSLKTSFSQPTIAKSGSFCTPRVQNV